MELRAAADWIAQRSPKAGEKWLNGFVNALLSLAKNPRRCGLARESKGFPSELRQLLFGRHKNYRAVYTIRDRSVVVLAIRHTSQDDISLDDF
jgi:plasmid stabilization system protein ParE